VRMLGGIQARRSPAAASAIASERFRRLRAEGAQGQRLLWASTGAKDPTYNPIKYVEPLIGADTVNTMPLETLEAYDEGGQPTSRLSGHADEARDVLAALADLGIDLDPATARLLDEGIEKFVQPYDALLREIESARSAALGGVRNRERRRAVPESNLQD